LITVASGASIQVDQSYALTTLTLNATVSDYAGGLIGRITNTASGTLDINDCYAVGTVNTASANAKGGGFIGLLDNDGGSTLNMNRNYTGVGVTGSGTLNGFLAGFTMTIPTWNYCIYDDTKNLSAGFGSPTAVVTSLMQDGSLTSFTTFSAGTWIAVSGHYPHLAWQDSKAAPLP
jgi:hypothetical protein